MPRRTGVLALAVLAATAVTAGCGGPGTAGALQGRVLSAADLPAGWSAVPANPADGQTGAPCLPSLPASPKGYTDARGGFVEGTSIPAFGEVLTTGPQAQQMWQSLGRALARCRTATVTIAGVKATATIQPLPFPRVASTTEAYAWGFAIAGVRIGLDLVLFRAGSYAGYLTYADLGTPAVATVQAFAAAAVAKAETGTTARVSTVSIASAPVRTAQTKLGTVAYRAIGSGPPLVLITGYSGTMQNWDRRFVDALAQRYRVVIFDNAGVGPRLLCRHHSASTRWRTRPARSLTPRPRPAGRPGLVDGHPDRPGPRACFTRTRCAPCPVRPLARQRTGDTALPASAQQRRAVPRRPDRRAADLPAAISAIPKTPPASAATDSAQPKHSTSGGRGSTRPARWPPRSPSPLWSPTVPLTGSSPSPTPTSCHG